MINISEYAKSLKMRDEGWRTIKNMTLFSSDTTLSDLVELYKNVWEWGLICNRHLGLDKEIKASGVARLRPRGIYIIEHTMSEAERETNYYLFMHRFPGAYKAIVDPMTVNHTLDEGKYVKLVIGVTQLSLQFLMVMSCGNGIWPILKLWGVAVALRNKLAEDKIEDVMKAVFEIIEEGNPKLFKMFDKDVFRKYVDTFMLPMEESK